jgi:dihydrofolate synthase/folylpolyglutamate synthase
LSDSYREMIVWLYAREAKLGMDFRLERLGPVLARLGNPHEDLPVVHVGGTNGKGSVAALLESVWRTAGYRTGLFTSPHLLSFRERIRINGLCLDRASTLKLVCEVRVAMDAARVELTFFEISTIAALLSMAREDLDVVILEVGLGGRLDATNVVERKLATVVTSIGLDHMEFLGPTEEKIAVEKAGVFREGVLAVVGDVTPSVAEALIRHAEVVGAPLELAGRDFPVEWPRPLSLEGVHQRRNAAVAARIVERLSAELPKGPDALDSGFRGVTWPGRMHRIAGSPEVILDGAHNVAAVRALVQSLELCPRPHRRVLVFAAMADKDWRGMLDQLAGQVDVVVAVPLEGGRALAPGEVVTYLGEHGRLTVLAGGVEEGLTRAREEAGSDGQVLVAGSVFLVAALFECVSGVGRLFEEGSLAA